MVWLGVILFIASGIAVLLNRRQVTHGIGMILGATAPAGCSVTLAVGLFFLAIAFIVLERLGILGTG